MNADETALIQKALSRLPLQRVMLFGSHAKGQARDDSDLDLLVVAPTEHPPMSFDERVQWIQRIRGALSAEGIWKSMDVLVYSREQWQDFIQADSGFAREIRTSALRIA